MKKNILFRKALTVVSVFALAALVMVSCKKKDDPTPDEPAVSNHAYYHGQSMDIAHAIKVKTQGMIGYQFSFSNGYALSILSSSEIDSLGANFTDPLVFVMTGQGLVGTISTSIDDNATAEIASGSFKVTERNGNYEIVCLAVTSENDTLDMYYLGAIVDMNKPTGSGSMTIDGENYPLQVGCVGMSDGLHCYTLLDTSMSHTFDFSSKNALGNGTYTISNNSSAIADGSAISASFSIVSMDGIESDSFEEELYSGTLTSSVNGNTYTISFSGQSESGDVSGSFTGTLNEIEIASLDFKSVTDKLRK